MYKFKVGDKVIGNKLANSYGITRKGWIGIVKSVEKNHFDAGDFPLLAYERFDLFKSYESEVPMKDIKYGVKYDRDTDPVEFFKSKPQAKKRIQELLDDPEVKKESIYLFQVGTVEKVQRLQNFELVKV